MLIGNQKIWKFLVKSAELSKIPHGFLFSGPEKVGKKTLALEFIKFLNCQNPKKESPCEVCRSCRDIQKNQHPDVFLVEPRQKEIQISQIKELIWKLSLRPFSAPKKAAVIDQAHCLNQEAQNSLLKTLEEPKEKVILILITESPELLFPTILSRVQKMRFLPVKKEEIENYLKDQGVLGKEAEEIVEISSGRPGLAIDFILNPKKLGDYQKATREIIKISNLSITSRFQYAKEMAQSENQRETLNIWLSYFRNILLESYSTESGSAGNLPFVRLKNILGQIQTINFLLSTTNINKRLALEILMLSL